jgi:hypothetical protein
MLPFHLSLSRSLSLNLPFSLVVHRARAILIRLLLVEGAVLVDGAENTARGWRVSSCTYSNYNSHSLPPPATKVLASLGFNGAYSGIRNVETWNALSFLWRELYLLEITET